MAKQGNRRANAITFGVIGAIVLIGLVLLFVLNGNENGESDAVNALSAAQLEETLDEKGEVVVYFYQTGCKYCEQVKPYLYPILEEEGGYSIDLAQHDVWSTYDIQGTPTLVRYKDGQEVGRISGAVSEEQYKAFFEGKN